MRHRPRLLAIAALSAFTALGCSSQPAAPSSVADAGPAAAVLPASAADPASTAATAAGGRAGSAGTVYVTSQGLYFDTFVAQDPLPMHGRFQRLENGQTEFGPGDPGYLGGRWWEDLNQNDVQDEGDHFFLCPLLPPGRPTP